MITTPQKPPSKSERRALLDDAMTAPPAEIGGLTMRRPSIGTIQLLHRTGNRLFSAEGPDVVDAENAINFIDDLLAFVYIHSAPIEQVLRACHGPRDEFLIRVTEFALTFDMDRLPELVESVQLESQMMDASRVSPEPENEGDSDPNGFGRSGTQA